MLSPECSWPNMAKCGTPDVPVASNWSGRSDVGDDYSFRYRRYVDAKSVNAASSQHVDLEESGRGPVSRQLEWAVHDRRQLSTIAHENSTTGK